MNISIGLLIGGNFFKALEPLEIIPSIDGDSHAFITLLGWCIVGPIGETVLVQQYHVTEYQFKA